MRRADPVEHGLAEPGAYLDNPVDDSCALVVAGPPKAKRP